MHNSDMRKWKVLLLYLFIIFPKYEKREIWLLILTWGVAEITDKLYTKQKMGIFFFFIEEE